MLARPYWAGLFLSLLLTLAAGGALLLVPLALRSLTDHVVYHSNVALLGPLALDVALLYIGLELFRFLSTAILRCIGERIVTDLRLQLYSRLQRLSLSSLADHPVGDLTSTLTNDVGSVRTAVTDAFVGSVFQSARFCGAAVLMLWLNWHLGLILIVIMPAAPFLSRLFSARLRQLARQGQDRLGTISAIAEEALSARQTVKVFTREPYEIRRYADGAELVFQTGRQSAVLSSLFRSLVQLAFSFGIVAVFWYGGAELIAGRLTAGGFVAFLLYSGNIAESAGELLQIYIVLNNAVGACGRIIDILNAPVELTYDSVSRRRSDISKLEFSHVSFGYGTRRPILCDLSFVVPMGETLALVGRSGAGKSTLLRLIPRLYEPTDGKVLFDGQDIAEVDLRVVREHVALVSQDIELFDATIRDNIRYGRLEATEEDVELAAHLASAHEFIVELPYGYDTKIGPRGNQLSSGQRQRIALARAFLKDAKILLLDEPTSSVDAISEALIHKAIERLTVGRITVVVAHHLETVRRANRIMALDEGSVVETGTHDDLMAGRGLYRKLVTQQFSDSGQELAW